MCVYIKKKIIKKKARLRPSAIVKTGNVIEMRLEYS